MRFCHRKVRRFRIISISFVAIGSLAIGLIAFIAVDNATDRAIPIPVNFVVTVPELPASITPAFIAEHALDLLRPQIIAGTLPHLSFARPLWLIGLESPTVGNFLHWDREDVYEQFLADSGKSPFGGFIFYANHFGGIYDIDGIGKYLDELTERYSVTITVASENSSRKYEVRIDPFLFSDCVPNNVPIHYCRLTRAVSRENDPLKLDFNSSLSKAEAYSAVGDVYAEIGFHSPLAPSVDFDPFAETVGDCGSASPNECRIKFLESYAVQSALNLSEHGIIPTLKHLGFNGRVDLHIGSYSDTRSLEEFVMQSLPPFDAVEALGIPYFIMTTHFVIASIDPDSVSTQSDKVVRFVRERFPNAVIMVDGLTMIGFSSDGNLRERVFAARGDLLLVQSGNWLPQRSRRHIYAALDERDNAAMRDSIERILRLKQHYGLMTVTRIDPKR